MIEQPRCHGTGQISETHDDPRGPEFNAESDSTAGGSIFTCPGCPDCEKAEMPANLRFSERELWQTCPPARPVLARLSRYRTQPDLAPADVIAAAIREAAVTIGEAILAAGEHRSRDEIAAVVSDVLGEQVRRASRAVVSP